MEITITGIAAALIFGIICSLVTFLLMKTKAAGLHSRIALLEAEKRQLEEGGAWLKEAEAKLRETFQALSSTALKENSTQFLERTREQLDSFSKQVKGDWGTQKEEFKSVVVPLNEELKKLDKQVQEMEKNREGAYRTMFDQVASLSRASGDLNSATLQLNQALRSSQVRGKWGEVQLRRIAEMAGMAQHVDFVEQTQTEEGGKPDMVVRMPNGGLLPVDAKTPMSAYLDSFGAADETAAKQKLKEHAASIRSRVKELSRKDYWKQFDTAPQFVVMLIPYESGLGAAFSEDPGLLDYALEEKVIIVSPATLLALLKVVAYGYLQLKLAENAEQIARQGRELYERIKTFYLRFDKVGKSLNASVDTYNKAVGTLQARIVPSVRRFQEMGVGSEELKEPEQVDNQARRIELEDDVPADVQILEEDAESEE